MEMISIIIPVYNAEHYLRRSLDSVLKQSFCQWEAICVNDGSTDASESILKEYSEKESRFKVITQNNGGASVARNSGIKAAKGDYLLFLDSDDELCPDCLRILWEGVERHPGAEMVIGAHEINGESDTPRIATYGEPGFIEGNTRVKFHAFKDEHSFYVVPWNKLIKKSILEDNDLYFKEGIIHEDELWSFFLYKKLKNVLVVNDVTYLHYVTPTSVMSTRTRELSAQTIFSILQDIVGHFDSPLRSLQVYKYLEYFRNHVYPVLPKKRTRTLYFSFFYELWRMNQYRIAVLWLLNRYHDIRHTQLYYQLIPKAYHKEVSKCLSQLNKGLISEY